MRLKWNDSGLEMMTLKPDILIIYDRIVQLKPVEVPMGALEVFKEDLSKAKHFYDHSKALVEGRLC
ncbi:hypothetical protein BCR43DRAFT_517870 [Syncephalastrum racemosum]|uniref:Uncharacterized protein n=1 Tax=Syncephalastrum racemosum TaxID=13706 RepID=A0A1X2H207_SYNRA|nr:hypothetical protein BCR43DRAFT_517870 [Syncephalastrum racemosum]